MRFADLQAEASRRYERLTLPSWPNPRPDMRSATAEEYSRVTDPQRYRVVHARARVWTSALEDLLDAEVIRYAPDAGAISGQSVARVTRVTSGRSGTLPLLFQEEDVPLAAGEGRLPVLRISLSYPDVVIATFPDCGCDACDCGSDDLRCRRPLRRIAGGWLAGRLVPYRVVGRSRRARSRLQTDGGGLSQHRPPRGSRAARGDSSALQSVLACMTPAARHERARSRPGCRATGGSQDSLTASSCG
jgi:hypothetical protein